MNELSFNKLYDENEAQAQNHLKECQFIIRKKDIFYLYFVIKNHKQFRTLYKNVL